MKKVRVAPKRLSSLDCTLREKSGRSWGVEEFNWIRPSKGTGPGRGDSGRRRRESERSESRNL